MGNLLTNDLLHEYELRHFTVKRVIDFKPLEHNELLTFSKEPEKVYILKHVNLLEHDQVIEMHRVKSVLQLQVAHICRFVFLAKTKVDSEIKILFTYGKELHFPIDQRVNLYQLLQELSESLSQLEQLGFHYPSLRRQCIVQ